MKVPLERIAEIARAKLMREGQVHMGILAKEVGYAPDYFRYTIWPTVEALLGNCVKTVRWMVYWVCPTEQQSQQRQGGGG